RFSRDWSSDVCSSDLFTVQLGQKEHRAVHFLRQPLEPLRHFSNRTRPGFSVPLFDVHPREIVNEYSPDLSVLTFPLPCNALNMRSEERRVGKECRGRR